MTNFLFYALAFAFVLGGLVIFHELGHYWAARWCGVKVLRFSIGFGRILWRRQFVSGGTEWAISLVPLGGYVKMLDEREGEVEASQRQYTFNRQSVGKRSLIVAAGPIANFILAILIYWGVFLHGNEELLPILGNPPSGTPAAMAGFSNGDEVKRVDGEDVRTWNELRWLLIQKSVDQESVEIEVLNDNQEISIRRLFLTAAAEGQWEGDVLGRVGVRFYRPNVPAEIGQVVDGGVAAKAGILPGDRVVAVGGKAIGNWLDFVEEIRRSAEQSIDLEIDRNGTHYVAQVRPELVEQLGVKIGKIGVGLSERFSQDRPVKTFIRYSPIEAAERAVMETWSQSKFSLLMMGKMLIGEVSWKNLSGPVTIADYAGQSARLGLDYYFKFMALLSVSLGVLNLLPIPVLDGGHLMYHIIEVVRRKPLSERAMELGQQIGVSILLALMAFAFFNDLTRLFNG